MSLHRLFETTYSDSLRVDRENSRIFHVKILGRRSRNRRVYTERAMEQAAALYEGVDVNIDHPPPHEAQKERKLAEGIGVIVNVRRTEDGVYGDLDYLKTHPLAEMVLERAERMPDKFGLSHNAEGRVTFRDGQMIVEGVERVLSVDLVRYPATNAGLFESSRNVNLLTDETPEESIVKTTVTQVLCSLSESSEDYHRALTPLLELLDRGDEAIRAAPLEIASDADHEQQLDAALRRTLRAITENENLALSESLDRIREVLGAHAALTTPPSGPTIVSSSENTPESLRSLTDRVEQLERRETARRLLEARRLTPTDLDDDRYSLLLSQQDRESMQRLIESWPPSIIAPKPPHIASARTRDDWPEQPRDAQAFALAVR